MSKSSKYILAALLTVFSVALWSIAIKSCQNKEKETNLKTIIKDEVQKKSDSVAIGTASLLDSVKLQNLKALKYRIAKARILDSIQSAKHK